MAFKEVRIKDELNGLPRQPVPLRLIPLITDWSVAELSRILSERINESGRADNHYEILTAHEYKANRKIGAVRRDDLKNRLGPDSLETSQKEAIKQIPPAYFVWSDELAHAFTYYIDRNIGRDEAVAQGLALNWNPALGDLMQLISQCSDFDQILPASFKKESQREKSLAWTEDRDLRICTAARDLWGANPSLTQSDIARHLKKQKVAVKRNGDLLSERSITRILLENNVGH